MSAYKYDVKGITCQGCVNSLTSMLNEIEGLEEVSVQLDPPTASFVSEHIPKLDKLNDHLGKYELLEQANKNIGMLDVTNERSWLEIYKPLLILVALLLLVTVLAQYPFHRFSIGAWMRFFMAGFFLSFSFFKLINVKGFADSYSMYDIVAGQWKSWGYIYPFVELILGLSYLINWNPTLTNAVTLIIMSIGTIGVVRANLSKQKIKCACLGDVFNLPMSTVTIIENVSMILMAAWMLV